MKIKSLPYLYISFLAISVLTGASTANGQQKLDISTEKKIESLIKELTLEEKIGMLHGNSSFTSTGVKRLGIPEIVTSDGPHGVRPEHGRDWVMDNQGNDSSTYLPVGITLASTWNPELGYAFGTVLGSEAKYRGKDIILGPGINIMRTPLNGRNFEYMSEDPFLISKMAVGYIKGVQDQGVSACVKHFMANNQEIRRDGINVEMSDRAMREIYLPGFKAAIQKGNVNSIMGAYNRFRGQFCTHNEFLNNILRKEWGFQGVMMSDWGAVHDTKQALLYGTDMEMGTDLSMLPNPDYNKFFLADPALKMVRSGEVPESLVDEKVRRLLTLMFKTNMFSQRTPGAFATKEHADVAKKIAREGIVLLKNQGNVLPLNAGTIKSIAVIGANANRDNSMGGGSSQVRPRYEITPLEGIQNLAGTSIGVKFAQGYTIAKDARADQKLIQEAVDAAAKSEVAIVVGGWTHGYDYSKWDNNAYDTEGFDKPDMNMPFGQVELIDAVLKANKNTIVVLFGGGPMDVSQWVGQAKAILQVGYPGQEGGNALAEILFGKVNPSGKLTVSWPVKLEDSPAHKLGQYPGDSVNVKYNEDIFVGYRYFDTFKIKPQFAFGHGLSYTTFKYDELNLSKTGDSVSVTFNLTNKGNMAGAEVVQAYVSDRKASVKRPTKELKAFQKVFLQPGESKKIVLSLPKDSFQYFDGKKQDWVLEPGKFDILIGSSAIDNKLKRKITL